jgi:lipopolysaccharide biosynthesis regulator YciM
VSALVLLAIVIALTWSVAREAGRRRRWREAERLSRCLFATAGLRKYG